jgi:hypothetical protein
MSLRLQRYDCCECVTLTVIDWPRLGSLTPGENLALAFAGVLKDFGIEDKVGVNTPLS